MDPNVFETANAGFAQSMYEDFLRDPASVGPEWRRLFESGVTGEQPNGRHESITLPSGGSAAGGANGNDRGNGAGGPAAAAPAAGAPAKRTAPSTGDTAPPTNGTPLKGPAGRLAANMNESLGVPTATTFRELPVAELDRRRRELNSALKAAGRDTKVSFTHLIAWAIVQAAKELPVMGHTYVETGGQAYRVEPDGISLGLAVDVTRKDGSRGLVVPVIKHAEKMDFAAFYAAYEELVEKSRTNKLMPDDFAGATMSLTNPGGLGTVASVPRLMAGQGTIIAVGAIGFPPEFAATPPERLRDLGLSKVMTMTSTYDHRVIQGAESGQFLGLIDDRLQGGHGFYQTVFEGMAVEAGKADGAVPTASTTSTASTASPVPLTAVAAAMALVKAFRTHGHLAARLDPLGAEPVGDPSLDPARLGLTPDLMAQVPANVLRTYVAGDTLAEILPRLEATYCGTIAYEVEHISSHEERVWLREQIETGAHRRPLTADEQRTLLARLTEVEAFERFLHKAYLGQKRFSIEGVDMLVPMLDLTIDLAAEHGANSVVLGMAHRGRLNVLTHTVGKPYEKMLAQFEGSAHRASEGMDAGTGDVKYHHGAEGRRTSSNGREIEVSLTPNPSHLEFVAPVVDGRVRARQTDRTGREVRHDPCLSLPVVMHGDAAFAGQGVVAETFNLSALPGYRVGGTLHIITNNQIGFTTDMREARSTRYASDLAKGFDVPIIHVNADDPEACLAAVRLAMAYRSKFHRDALIDLVGYRRHGHNEGDEPTYTQPRMYAAIKSLPTARARYAEQLAASGTVSAQDAEAQADAAYQRLVEVQQRVKEAANEPAPAAQAPRRPSGSVASAETAVDADRLRRLNEEMLTWPEGFTVHPKLKRQLERRRDALEENGVDWGHAEALAFASLLVDGTPLRLTGQDTERGTFSHRHLVLHDAETDAEHVPARAVADAHASLEVLNSPLSELATMGFEYGYNADAPETLVMWEGQFGDFVNGAQVIVDQFISAGLSKWGVTSRLTLLLPHGYEGQGPEHSSARLERFLQLAAENNIRVANCTTPAQYFHLLRRQAKLDVQRPLVVMTPKSLLRLPQATSGIADLSGGTFQPVMDDDGAARRADGVRRVVLCSGKVYYDLLTESEKLGDSAPALVRVEQLYPFPADEITALLDRYPNAREVSWCQEEPRNMGAFRFVEPRLRELLGDRTFAYVGRPDRASPAEGYPQAHAAEQARIVKEALTGGNEQ